MDSRSQGGAVLGLVSRSGQSKTPAAGKAKPGPNSQRHRWGDGPTLFACGVLTGLALGALDRMSPPVALEAPGSAARASKAGASWKTVLVGAAKDFGEDRIPAVAAGVTFYGLLALFPALSAFVSMYGLFANVDDARRQVAALGGLLPGGAVSVLGDQMTRLAAADHKSLGLTLMISLLVSIWSSNAGMKALIGGLNVSYDEKEKRNFVNLNIVSLGFTLGGTVFATLAMAAVVAAPSTLDWLGLGRLAGVSLLRWPVLLLVVIALLSVLYRYGPSREHARWRWITPGGIAGGVGWMAMSLLFSWYVANFGSYDRTYGSLGAVVGFMTWIWLSVIVVLFGAELNAELELQTPADTTTGAPRPAGQRGAVVADHIP